MIVLKNAQSLFKKSEKLAPSFLNNRMQTLQNSRITSLFKANP
ncbi:hypothetical protein ACQJ65_00455 [Helicobacter pylori]